MVKTGIPVPATIPEASRAFIICVPDDAFFMGVVAGAIKTMMFRYYWQGTEDQIDAVTERMKQMYLDYQSQDGCMICEQIIECINSDPGTREAMVNWFVAEVEAGNPLIIQAVNEAYNPIAPGQNMPPDVTGQSLTPPNPTCDLDLLFGQCDKLIEQMNTNNIDAQQVIESFTNVAERVSELVQAIPGIGILPVDEIIDYAQTLWSDDLFEAYEANDTDPYRTTLKCELFCLAQDNDCSLTLDLILQYFGDRLGSDPSDTLADIIIYLLSGTWSGTEINDLFFYAQAVFMKFGNDFFGTTGLNPFKIYMSLADPNDNWPILCPDCGAVCFDDYDFTASDGGWLSSTRVIPGFGNWSATYIASTGWRCTAGDGGYSPGIAMEMIKAYDSAKAIEKVEVWYTLDEVGGSGNNAGIVDSNLDGSAIAGFSSGQALISGANKAEWSISPAHNISNGYVGFNANEYFVSSGATLTVTRIRITYTC